MADAPKNIRLLLSDYAPPEVLTASATARRAFLDRFAELALHLKRRMIVQGRGPDGKRFAPRKRPREDGASGAPLAPHGQESRSARLLAVHIHLDFIVLYWRGYGRKSWAKILGYHAMGEVKGAPVRNEFALDPKTERQLKETMKTWWKTRNRPKPKPEPPAPAAQAAKPKPKPKPPKPLPVAAKPRPQALQAPKRGADTGPQPTPVALPGAAPSSTVAVSPLLPGRPIAERIAAYQEGHAKVEAIAKLHYDVQAAETMKQAAQAEVVRLEASLKGLKGNARKAAQAEVDAAAKTLSAHSQTAYETQAKARQAAMQHLMTGHVNDLHAAPGSIEALNPTQQDSAKTSVRFLQHMANLPPGTKVNFAHSADDRAYCTPGELGLASKSPAATSVHELGHHMDYWVPGCDKAAREFLAYRCGDEQRVPLNSVLPGHSYDADEVGRKDKFDDAFGGDAYYVGKDYEGGMTEITAMGVEALYRDPIAFARKDPEYAKFVIGLLHGHLR